LLNMKNYFLRIVTIIIATGFIVLSFNCHKNAFINARSPNSDSTLISSSNETQAQNKERLLSPTELANQSFTTTVTGNFACGSFINDEYFGHGYHLYTGYTLDLNSTPPGATITLTLNSFDVPNRFTVYDAAHHAVARSAWMGFANYSGPWGMTIN